MGIFLLSFILGLAAATHSEGAPYPYQNPLYATFTASLLKAPMDGLSPEPRKIRIKGLAERNSVPFYGSNRNHLEVVHWPARESKGAAPLLILLSGVGGSASSTYLNYLARIAQQAGWQALALPSAYHWTFALSRSRSGLPGDAKADATDLAQLLRDALKHLSNAGFSPSSLSLLGVSMGALHGAELFLEHQSEFGFKKVISVNPPLDLAFASNSLKKLRSARNLLSPEKRKSARERAALFILNSLVSTNPPNDSYFANLESRLGLNNDELSFLMGESLQEFLAALVFTSQQVRDLGVLPGPVATNSAKDRLEAAKSWSFDDYAEKILLPGLGLSKEEWAFSNSFMRLVPRLKEHPNFTVFHNRDDFLVDGAEWDALERSLEGRLVLKSSGGHVGNLWHEDFQSLFRGFLSAP